MFSNPALQGSSTGILGLDNLSSGDMHDSSGWNVNFPKMKSQQRNPREIAASETRTKRYAYGLTGRHGADADDAGASPPARVVQI